MWRVVLLVAILALGPYPAWAQTLDALVKDIQRNAPTAAGTPQIRAEPLDLAGYNAFRMEEERSRRYLVGGLLFATVVSQILVLLFLMRGQQCTPSAIVHGSGLVLVVYATIMVVVLARADQQLTAAIGILGAIAGYLFGSATREPGLPRPSPPAGG